MDKFGASLEGNIYFIYVNVVLFWNLSLLFLFLFHIYTNTVLKQKTYIVFRPLFYYFHYPNRLYVYNSLNSAHSGFNQKEYEYTRGHANLVSACGLAGTGELVNFGLWL